MIAESGFALNVFDRISKIIQSYFGRREVVEGQKDEALEAINVALRATKEYLNRQSSGASRDTTREYEIAELWQRASLPLRRVDPEFAARCFDKGGYWMQPEIWSPDDIAAKGIRIDQMLEETRKIYIPPADQ